MITPEASQELMFWLREIAKFNGRYIWPRPSAVRMVYSDASVVERGNLVMNGQWSKHEAQESSTWWELRAVRLALVSFQTFLRNERVCWFSDNQNLVRIVQYGSRKPTLQAEALAIFVICMKNLIRIEPEWIPREQNKLANYLSWLVEYEDWMLNPEVFSMLDATIYSRQICQFCKYTASSV